MKGLVGMTLRRFLETVLLVFAICLSGLSHANPGKSDTHPFAAHLRISGGHLYVVAPSLFRRTDRALVSRPEDAKRDVGRHRLGAVQLSPNVEVFVERATALTHGASFLELFDRASGKLVGSFDLGLISPSEGAGDLLFNGQGMVYWYQRPPYLCAGETTRKFVLRGRQLLEVPQPFLALNYTAETTGAVRLYASEAQDAQVVADVPNGTKVQVVGVVSDMNVPSLRGQYPGSPSMLVRTPLGLVGWYVPSRSGGTTSITACN
jgi:hypothetical protein